MSSADLEFEEDLELDEARLPTRWTKGRTRAALDNPDRIEVNERQIVDGLKNIDGLGEVKHLKVRPSSTITDLQCVAAFPALETLSLHGLALRTLAGIGAFMRGRYLAVETGRNRKRDIGHLHEAPVRRLSLSYGNPGDIEAVGRSRTMAQLTISGLPELRSSAWSDVPLETLQIFGGGLEEFAEARAIGALRSLTFNDCRKLSRFEGDSSNVQWMVVEACNKVDWETIAAFRGLRHLHVVNIKSAGRLSMFASLKELKTLSFQNSRVEIDVKEPRQAMPAIEKLMIPVSTREAIALSIANPGVIFSTRTGDFKAGVAIEVSS